MIVNMYNAGGHDEWYRIPFLVEPLTSVIAAVRGSTGLTNQNGGEMSWEHRVSPADMLDLVRPSLSPGSAARAERTVDHIPVALGARYDLRGTVCGNARRAA